MNLRARSIEPHRYQKVEPFDVQTLKKQLAQQQTTIEELMRAVQESRQRQTRVPIQQEQYQKTETDEFNFEILKEIRSIKRQIQQIENGPMQMPQLPQMPQNLQMPSYSFAHSGQYQQPNQFHPQLPQIAPYNINPYQHYHTNQNYPFNPFQPPQYPIPYQQYQPYPYYTPQQDTTSNDYKAALLKMLKKGQLKLEPSTDKRSGDHHHSRTDRHRHHNRTNVKSNKTKTQLKSQQVIKPVDPMARKLLKRKLKGVIWYVYTAVTLQKLLKKGWVKRREDFMKLVPDKLAKFDTEFQLNEVLIQLVIDCNKIKLLSKDWVFTGKSPTAEKCQLAILFCKILFEKLPILTKTFSDAHKQFIAQISTKNAYLTNLHPKFVTNRVSQRSNCTISPLSVEQSKMIQMDYIYNSMVLPRIITIHTWYSQYQKIPNYKEAMKIIASMLHQLYIDKFTPLPSFNEDLPYNKLDVVYCDFTKANYPEVMTSIDSNSPLFTVTENCAILGLYAKQDLQFMYNQTTFKDLQGIFEKYCTDIYELVTQPVN